jgi:hypothetical protein
MPKGPKINIDYNKIYISTYGEEYKIIKDLGSDHNNKRKVNIQFLKTGNIKEVELYKANKGQVIDRNKLIPDFNTVYQSNNCGPFIFLELLGSKGTNNTMAKVKFLETGTICNVYLKHALSGSIKDKYYPSVCGIGYLGNASTNNRWYDVWYDLIRRCYDKKDPSYNSYGGKGITVCQRWLCFEYFIEDIKYLPGYDLCILNPGKYDLDKDMLQMDVPEHAKVYSPKTCCFIDKITNIKYGAKYQNENCKTTSRFMGVYDSGPLFLVNAASHYFGRYKTEKGAAAMYNKVTQFYYPNIDPNLLNDVPPMTMDEIQAQRVGAKVMCNVINKEMCKIIHK